MEIHVEAAQPEQLPKGCYVSVRVGDVLKQGRYEPQRAYNFPAINRRRDVRIDVYQHVGSSLLTAEPESRALHDTYATSTHPDFPAMKFKVSVSTKKDEVQQSKNDRASKMKGRAKEYLGQHRIEEHLSEAVKALLKEQPAEPIDFICKFLGTKKLAPLSSSKPSSKPMKPKETKDVAAAGEESYVSLEGAQPDARNDMPDVRKELCGLLVEAAENGKLSSALKASQGEAGNEGLRLKVATALANAAENGDLSKICKDYQPVKDVEDIRNKAANLLISSADNGELRKALQGLSQQSPRHETVQKTASLLAEAAENGELQKALTEMKSPRQPSVDPLTEDASLEKLRLKVGNQLLSALENGDLERAAQESANPAPPDAPEEA